MCPISRDPRRDEWTIYTTPRTRRRLHRPHVRRYWPLYGPGLVRRFAYRKRRTCGSAQFFRRDCMIVSQLRLGTVSRIDDAQAALEEAAILRDQAPERFDDFRYST